LFYMRQFYNEYPDFIHTDKILHALRGESSNVNESPVSDEARRESKVSAAKSLHHAMSNGLWQPGVIHPNLSWTHYRTLLKVKRSESRSFYEIESINNGWSARQLERQINSLLFERLLKSRDKKGVMALANKGLVVNKPIDIIKDPMILEFLDLPESHRLVETKVEAALISKLKDFLLELGSGFAFVGRQKRLTLEGDHFYPDLVFYHIRLKCYCIIDLKTQKLNHGDLGQMLMYVNYYDKEIKTKEENPTIGLILCTDKNDAVAEYVLDNKRKRIFASRYQYELPTVEELERELRHEMELLSSELLPVKSVQRTPTTRKKSGSVVKKEKRAVK
ncbi:MAG: PDDEXK nuclease domain-containing protein, partial [Fibrobacterota bacterium]